MHQLGPADQPARPAYAHRHAQAARPARPRCAPTLCAPRAPSPALGTRCLRAPCALRAAAARSLRSVRPCARLRPSACAPLAPHARAPAAPQRLRAQPPAAPARSPTHAPAPTPAPAARPVRLNAYCLRASWPYRGLAGHCIAIQSSLAFAPQSQYTSVYCDTTQPSQLSPTIQ